MRWPEGESTLKSVVVGLCAYEISAILTRRHRTLSAIMAPRPWLERAAVQLLAWHLEQMRAQEPRGTSLID